VSEQKTTAPALAAKSEPVAPKSAQPAAKAEPAAPKAESPAPKAAPVASATPVKYKPLNDVKDDIRKNLARQAAHEKIHEVLHRVQDRLAQFETQWTLYDTLEPEKKKSTTAPTRPDFVALAKEHRLTAAETGLMSGLQISGTDIGKSRIEGGGPFNHAAFEKSYPTFRPGTSEDNDGNSYLFWKVDDTPEKVPKFDEEGVHQRVLDEWKLVQARDVAAKEAEKLAADARKANKSLAEVLAGRKDLQVLAPAPFTWLTFGNVPVWFHMRPPQFSEVTGIPGAGKDFMRAVFALKAGEIGLATDQPQATIYVVRLVEYTPIDSVLWDMFVADDYRGYAMAARDDQMVAGRRWNEGIRADAGLKWQRDPSRGKGDIED
jgi:hypothetical protein